MSELFHHIITDSDVGTVADSSGNSRHLTVTAPVGEAAFGDDAYGRHFAVTAGNRTSLAKLQSASLDQLGQAAALQGLQKFTILLSVVGQQNGNVNGTFYWHLGTAADQTGILCIRKWSTGPWQVIFGGGSKYVQFWSGDINAIVVDTTQADRANRVRLYRTTFGVDTANTTLTPVLGSTELEQNWAINIPDPENTFLTLMNAAGGANNGQGNACYHAVLNQALSEAQVFQIFDSVKLDHDASAIPAASPPSLAGSTVEDIGGTSAVVHAVTDTNEGPLFCWVTTGAVEDDGDIRTTGDSVEVAAAGTFEFPQSGLALNTDHYAHLLHDGPAGTTKLVIPFSTLAQQTATTPITVAMPAGYHVATLGNDIYQPATQGLQRRPLPGWQMISLAAQGQWTERGTWQGDTVGVIDTWIIDELGYMSYVTLDTTSLAGAIRPNTPDLSPNVIDANPGSQHVRTFAIAGAPVETPVTWYAQDGAVLQLNGGVAAGQVTGELDDIVTVNGYASDEYEGVLHPGVIGPGGVSASFQITTRAAAAPNVPPLTGPSAVSVGTAATIESDVTGATSLRWEVNGEEVVGADAVPLVFTPPAIGAYSFVLFAESAEGGITQSAPFVLNAIAVATRVQIPELRNRATGLLRGGEQNVPLYVLSDNRSQRLISAATINLAASGVTPFVHNDLGAAGTWVRVGFPAANGNTAVEIRLQVEA